MTVFSEQARLSRRRAVGRLAGLVAAASPTFAAAVPATPAAGSTAGGLAGGAPVRIGIDGEFGLVNSTSAQAVELGARVALAEINRAGGVLGGRPLALVTRDHRSIAARGIRNMQEFAAMPDLVAVLGGRFSPVIIEQLPLLREAGLPFMAVWSSADVIVDNGSQPNFVFRVSLRDSLAMPFMLDSAARRGLDRVGLLLTNTAWGRSNLAAAERHQARGRQPRPRVTSVAWYN